MTVTTEARQEAMRLYHHANRERILEKKREYREARRQELREKQLAYRWANIEAERERDRIRGPKRFEDPRYRAKALERNRRWRKSNPEQGIADAAKRRARKLSAPVVEKVDREAIIARDRGVCHICGRKVRPNDIHLDHLVPLSKGGEHSTRNIAVAHSFCNQSRRDGRIPAQLRLIG